MNGIQRYTINLIENEIDQSCPYIEKYKMPDGKWCKYSDVEAALSASPWTPIIEKHPTDHHPGYLVRGLDDIPHKAFWNDDHWIFDGARLEANAFIDWMEIPA